ncbi:MAG: Abi family protein [Ruminococcus flavefaciens]|nr:Abi family protein [Ruminococcus flavefaciens]
MESQISAIVEKVPNRPKLSFEGQIEYLRDKKGIQFNITNEENAKKFLKDNNYFFKIKAYAKNYSKYGSNQIEKAGKYIDLEFAYLVELSTIDMYLREKILKLSLNIEHYLKLQLLNDVTLNECEDGYITLHKFLDTEKPKLIKKIDEKSSNSYCSDLINHRKSNFAIWDIIEVISFGDFVDL